LANLDPFKSKTMQPTEIKTLNQILEQYEVVIFDVWGTIYDGKTLFPNTIQVLEHLRTKNKTIIFLSNSPQLAAVVEQRLLLLGISERLFDHVVTSGEEAKRQLKEKNHPEANIFTGPVYLTGPTRYPNTIPENQFPIEQSIKKSNWILNSGPNSIEETVEDYHTVLQTASDMKLPMLCTNPDKTVLHGSDTHICAGALASYYQHLGGKVSFIGKPYKGVFERCKEISGGIDSSKCLMVGDNLETDILGANNHNLDSLLLGSGVHQLSNAPDLSLDRKIIETLQEKFHSKATYVMQQLI